MQWKRHVKYIQQEEGLDKNILCPLSQNIPVIQARNTIKPV